MSKRSAVVRRSSGGRSRKAGPSGWSGVSPLQGLQLARRNVTSQNAYDYRGHGSEIWAAHYLSALAKALMEDAELGMMR